ncbi:MAG: 3-hydroxybutyryl-CoA dehydrogenase [Actinobacteria bacterium]|nr:MAG: 3-hydroxybutyryl-CoA dehydrogenase [Actinomycetota bacterium]
MGKIKSVGVIGSGIMGSGLAEVAARSGFDVVVRSRTQAGADAVLSGIDAGLTKQVSRERLTEADRKSILSRISVTEDLHELGDCDLVIESVVEDMEIKRDIFTRLDEITRPDAILATNTSTLAVVELAVATRHPERVCGIHFFNPAPMMKLVEVIVPLTASEETISAALGFASDCGKDAVKVQDRAGFIVNALLFPYLNNAIRMWEQGTASMDDIDTAMQGGCNFPMGPFALLDLVGLDTSLAILDALYEEFRDPNFAAAPALRRMVAAGRLGRKTKQGFRSY